MPRMIELIRSSAASSGVMQTAARGALSVPPQEMIEILVYLATQTKIFAERARLTLAGWDEASSRATAADPRTPKEVLAYMITPGNLRPTLLPALLENPAVSEESLAELAAAASRYIVETLIKSARVNQSKTILGSLSSNPHLNPVQSAAIAEKLSSLGPPAKSEPESTQVSPEATKAGELGELAVPKPVSPETGSDDVPEEAITAYLTEHATEISAEADKPFHPIGGVQEELMPHSPALHPEPAPAEAKTEAVASSKAQGAAAAAQRAPAKKVFLSAEEQRGSALQKIAKLDIKGRIQLAMKGNKEERSLLIRDGTKVVALAVLESPKITDSEVEKFANQKNVLEAVLRAITMKRRFMKQYAVVRNLTFNPRAPIDVALGLVKHLLTADLRNLSGNKEVSDTVRKMATRMFRQKLEVTNKD
ncbi:MAG TPA: hypothetical protein VN948_11600 [Terriglobales bacterium]|nr:hypothetical protein [Terriglobales bacterium]